MRHRCDSACDVSADCTQRSSVRRSSSVNVKLGNRPARAPHHERNARCATCRHNCPCTP
jgi:hypothetical protein